MNDVEDGWLCGTGSFFMEPSSSMFTEYIIKFFLLYMLKDTLVENL